MHKSRVVLGCMALALILALLIPLVGCGGGGPAVPCKISSVTGTVQVLRSGSTNPVNATNGMELGVGDTITTGSNGSATLTFFDGSVMEIKASSEILVNELSTASTGSTTVSLMEQVGSTINRIGKLVDSSSKYEVETPAAVAVVRGTVFDLLVQQNGTTTVKAEQDSVSFTASGVTVTVNQGFQSSASVGGTPSTPSAITTTGATATPQPTTTAASAGTLASKVYAYIGDFKCDEVTTTSAGQQQMTRTLYLKDAYLLNKMKARYEMTYGGYTMVTIMDYGSRTTYSISQGTCYKTTWEPGTGGDVENAEQIQPEYLGTATIDGKLCDVYQWTYQDTTGKAWVWREHKFPIKFEMTSPNGTATIEYKNIVFGTLSNDLFVPPADCSTQPTYSY